MTVAQDARQAARSAKHSDSLRLLTRIGFVGFGATHLVLAWIAMRIAFGRAPTDADQVGAFALLREGVFGTLLLVVVAIGLAAMTVWQLLEAAVGHGNAKASVRRLERIMSAGRAGAYGLFAYEAAKLVLHPTAAHGAAEKQQAAGTLLGTPSGRWLVAAIGVTVVAVGLGLLWYGLTRHFERHLRGMTVAERRTMRLLGTVGYTAKAVAYTVAGVLVVSAAVRYDPSASRGLDAALRTLAQQPWGAWLLLAIAAGIAAYGLFAIAQSRYRQV